jgi:hypothetical protein
MGTAAHAAHCPKRACASHTHKHTHTHMHTHACTHAHTSKQTHTHTAISGHQVIPAIAAGCCTVLKPRHACRTAPTPGASTRRPHGVHTATTEAAVGRANAIGRGQKLRSRSGASLRREYLRVRREYPGCSELAPLSCLLLADLAHQAGLPAGALNVVRPAVQQGY